TIFALDWSSDVCSSDLGQPNRSLADTTNAAQAKEGVINAPSGAAKTAAPASEQSDTSTSSKAEQPVSWLQQNLLGVITAILALRSEARRVGKELSPAMQ